MFSKVRIALVATALLASTSLVSAQDAIDWTGAYAGLYVGGTSSTFEPDAMIFGSADTDGLGAGAFAGYNFDMDGIVFGFEADIGAADGTASYDAGEDGYYSASIDWAAHLRGRVGVAVEQALFYVAGGAAIAGVTLDANGDTYEETYFGWSLGVGVEYAITDMASIRLEYTHDDFGTASFDGTDIDLDSDSVRAGFSLKF